MNRIITPGPLGGKARIIGSKSDAHRLMICAALADEPTRLENTPRSRDIEATARCLRAAGAEVNFSGDGCAIRPIAVPAENPLLDCGESGTTFRFMLPVAAAVCGSARFLGAGRLPDRPIGELADAMAENGAVFSGKRLPFSVSGGLGRGEYVLPGDVSSQYISGLLIGLTQTPGESLIRLSSPLESGQYVAMTCKTLGLFGAETARTDTGYRISGGRLHSPGNVRVEGDWSSAAFFLAAGALGGGVSVAGLDTDSVQADRAVVDILSRFGAKMHVCAGLVTADPGKLRGCDVDLAETPDLLPILAVVAAFAHGESRFYNGGRLRLKESDRLETTCAMLRALGGDAQTLADGLIVRGKPPAGGRVSGAGDHRIVMAAAVAAAYCGGPSEITGAEAVEKSYPDFFEVFAELGGNTHVV